MAAEAIALTMIPSKNRGNRPVITLINAAWKVTVLPQNDFEQEMHRTGRDLAAPVIKYNSLYATEYAYGIYVSRAQSLPNFHLPKRASGALVTLFFLAGP